MPDEPASNWQSFLIKAAGGSFAASIAVYLVYWMTGTVDTKLNGIHTKLDSQAATILEIRKDVLENRRLAERMNETWVERMINDAKHKSTMERMGG